MCKNRRFLIGLVRGFFRKSNFLPFFGKPRKERSLFNILDRKEYIFVQKSEVSKTSVKLIFSKELVHGSCQKVVLFSMCTFLANQERKDRFLIFREENNKCQTRKVKFPKGLKNRIFQRVQSMVFVQKLSFLLCGFLGTPRQKRVFF